MLDRALAATSGPLGNLPGPTYPRCMPRGMPPSHWVAPDLGLFARAVRSAQERFLSGEEAAMGTVRSLVVESWQRSLREGVDPQADAPPLVWDSAQLEAARNASPLQGAMPMVRSLLTDPASAGGHVVAVGDDQGRLLWVEGDRGLRTKAESMGFVAGTQWSEHAAGTNAPGTALTLDSPVQIFASEHFRGPVQPWSCTAVPIHDPHSGRILGVLDVTGQHEVATPQANELGVTLQREGQEITHHAVGRATPMRQAMELILQEAIASSPAQGEVRASLLLRETEVWVEVRDRGDDARSLLQGEHDADLENLMQQAGGTATREEDSGWRVVRLALPRYPRLATTLE